jgi:hypothetical protein
VGSKAAASYTSEESTKLEARSAVADETIPACASTRFKYRKKSKIQNKEGRDIKKVLSFELKN